MADAVGLWVIVYFCMTSVNTKDSPLLILIIVYITKTDKLYHVVSLCVTRLTKHQLNNQKMKQNQCGNHYIWVRYIVYNIDGLLIRLQKSGVGCHMNNIYMGALSYADDITISCLSFYDELNDMIKFISVD